MLVGQQRTVSAGIEQGQPMSAGSGILLPCQNRSKCGGRGASGRRASRCRIRSVVTAGIGSAIRFWCASITPTSIQGSPSPRFRPLPRSIFSGSVIPVTGSSLHRRNNDSDRGNHADDPPGARNARPGQRDGLRQPPLAACHRCVPVRFGLLSARRSHHLRWGKLFTALSPPSRPRRLRVTCGIDSPRGSPWILGSTRCGSRAPSSRVTKSGPIL